MLETRNIVSAVKHQRVKSSRERIEYRCFMDMYTKPLTFKSRSDALAFLLPLHRVDHRLSNLSYDVDGCSVIVEPLLKVGRATSFHFFRNNHCWSHRLRCSRNRQPIFESCFPTQQATPSTGNPFLARSIELTLLVLEYDRTHNPHANSKSHHHQQQQQTASSWVSLLALVESFCSLRRFSWHGKPSSIISSPIRHRFS